MCMYGLLTNVCLVLLLILGLVAEKKIQNINTQENAI